MLEIPIKLSPRLYKAMEAVCKHGLAYSQNHKLVRDAVNNLVLLLQQEAGETTAELTALRGLLRRTDSGFDGDRPKALQDPIEDLGLGSNPKLSPDQQAAALAIKRIWTSFGRFLQVASRNLEASGKKGRTLDPLDVMSDEVAVLWEETYKNWYQRGKRTFIGRSGCNEAEVTLRIVVEGCFPEETDRSYNLPTGSSLTVLQHQLDQWNGR